MLAAGSAVRAATTSATGASSLATNAKAVLEVKPLGFVWDTLDPFLFCVFHHDVFPAAGADGKIPQNLLRGRNIGQDFELRDGFRMYHGTRGIPGFPSHPHFGFETVTVVREGKVDHYDSLGATARFGGGGSDTQWVTCGNGMAHSEMFPLINSDKPNPMVLFQLWLNLPAASKKSDPYFTMLWSEKNPVLRGPGSTVTVIADEAKQFSAAVQSPPPDSFASKAGSNVAIVLIELAPGGEFTLPATAAGTNRKLFYYSGPAETTVAGVAIKKLHGAKLDPTAEVLVSNAHGTEEAKYLLLQGKPIGEPVVQQGPFVTNDRAEMAQVYARYQRTQFGGWPWESNDPAHPLTTPRFARHPDGREEFPDQFKE